MSPALLFLRYLYDISAGSAELLCHWRPDMALCLAAVLAVSGNALVSINVGVVTLRWARLVPGWVTAFGRVNYLCV